MQKKNSVSEIVSQIYPCFEFSFGDLLCWVLLKHYKIAVARDVCVFFGVGKENDNYNFWFWSFVPKWPFRDRCLASGNVFLFWFVETSSFCVLGGIGSCTFLGQVVKYVLKNKRTFTDN